MAIFTKSDMKGILSLIVLGFSVLVSTTAQDIVPQSLMPEQRDTLTADTLTSLSWEQRLKTSLDQLAREADNAYFNTGICVWDLTADSMLAYYTGSISPDSTLTGDIYVVGSFDPMYSYGDIRELARAVRDLGIRRISGSIYGDASMKNNDLYGNGWCWDDVPSKYEPYLCALMLERGRSYPHFSSYSKDANFHPATHFAYVLSRELQELSIMPADTLRPFIDYGMKNYPGNGRNFHTKTRTIDQVMQRMLKNSDNLHAEAVFFQLAHVNQGKYCSWKDGARQVENVIRKAGASTAYVEVADGSGVSLYNYVSPETEVAMLRYAFRNQQIYRYFYPALPIAGVDGTLSDRMRSGCAYRNVHAKTGTLEGVIALTGYVSASNGHQLAFSILINGVLQAKTARDYQDRFCQELAR